ncbi:MAG: MFS transporter, partial [Coriobacteriales bacterium]|nr:MFS transporter [Coriobacteriales bacterium]
AITALIPAFGIRERDYVKPQSSYLPLFKSMVATFRIKHFRALMWPFLIMQIAFAFFNTAMLFYIDTLLGLNEGFATIVLGLSIVIGIATYPLVNFLARRFGKRPPLLFACGCYFFIYLGIYFCVPIATALGSDPVSAGPLAVLSSLAGPGATSGEVLFALALGVAIAFPIACTNILPLASFADIAQYDEILSGINKSGMFMAVRTFLSSLSNAVIVAVIGWMMYAGAPNPEYPTFFGVQLTALVAAVTVLAAMLLYARYNDPLVVATINQHKAAESPQGSEAV